MSDAMLFREGKCSVDRGGFLKARAHASCAPASVKVTTTCMHSHTSILIRNINNSRHMIGTAHAFKDILIVPTANERIHLSYMPGPMRGTIAQCSLSSAWELTIICPTFLTFRAAVTVTSMHFRDWLSWHNVAVNEFVFMLHSLAYFKCFIH